MVQLAYQIAVTFRCNSKCKWCCERLDVVSWDHMDTDITLREIRVGARLLRERGLTVGKLRLTGGEPLLHLGLSSIVHTVNRTWKSSHGFFRVYTNGTLPRPRGLPTKFSAVPLNSKKKTECFTPVNVSPADLGIAPVYGSDLPCQQQTRCGRAFNCFGFSFCAMAGTIGGLLGVDYYVPYPAIVGDPAICQHCLVSLPKRVRSNIIKSVREGKIPSVTKTYQLGIERWKDDPFRPMRFLKRLAAAEKNDERVRCKEDRTSLAADLPVR